LFSVLLFIEFVQQSVSGFQVTSLHNPKVSGPNSVTYCNWIPIFEWDVSRSGSQNRYGKGMCSQEIGLNAPYMFTIIGSLVNMYAGTHMIIEDLKDNLKCG